MEVNGARVSALVLANAILKQKRPKITKLFYFIEPRAKSFYFGLEVNSAMLFAAEHATNQIVGKTRHSQPIKFNLM